MQVFGLHKAIYKLKKIASVIKIPLVVSGGVANIRDIKKLYKASLFEGVIIGRAIYDNSIPLDQLRNLFK